jgi:hypothetical protein
VTFAVNCLAPFLLTNLLMVLFTYELARRLWQVSVELTRGFE